jgi:hypothetical protein
VEDDGLTILSARAKIERWWRNEEGDGFAESEADVYEREKACLVICMVERVKALEAIFAAKCRMRGEATR